MISEFCRVWPWLEKAAKRYGDTHTRESVLQRLLDGRAQLWTERNAALITSIERYDTGMVEVRGWLGAGKPGRSLTDLRKIEKRVEAWAKSIGAQRLTILGRRGWLRALTGWRELAVLIVRDF